MTSIDSTDSTDSIDYDAAAAQFDATTSFWGRLTMVAALLVSAGAPLYLVMSGGLDVTQGQLWGALLAVAGTFFMVWIVEPLTYYPILGQAAMYQAFMIGNISSKLLPAAVVAQAAIGVKPGTKKAELAACLAICGAAVVHLISLTVFVGLLGTWLLGVIPPSVIEVTRLYVLPAVLGAVGVQGIVTLKAVRPTLTAIVVAAVVIFGVLPLVPVIAPAATAIVVLLTIAFAWLLRDRRALESTDPTPETT